MLAPARRLDRDYTVIGRVLGTNAVLQQLAVGEPPSQPDTMVKVRLLAELPPDQRPRVFGPTRTALQQSIQQARTAKGADFSICDVNVPSRIEVQTTSTEPPPKTR
jgi:peptidylprolyl isomerase